MNPAAVAYVRWAVEWAALEDMQEFAARYCRRRYGPDLGDRAHVAVHELLENAVRYAISGTDVVFELNDTRTGFEARVTNEAVESRIALLRRRVEDVRGHDPADAYQRALRKLMAETVENSFTVGLGLLRVRHEASVDLSLEVVGRTVTMIASTDEASGGTFKLPTTRRDLETHALRSTGEKHGKLR